ncbi:hypothetical protein Trydic_g10168 [Trypoxylus dichotomus]
MDLLEPDDVPLTVNEDIIRYLKEQDLLGEEEEEFLQSITNFTEASIRQILEDLLKKFEKKQKLKDDYEERVEAHNQYFLFDLKNVIPEFQINDEMYEALTFRETLIVQRIIDGNELAPEPVGGLCLDIQQAKGKQPPKRECDDIDSRLARIWKAKPRQATLGIDEVRNVKKELPAGDTSKETDLEDSLHVQAERCIGKFLVHLSSQFDFNGYNAGSTITTWVDRNFHTLEESRKEWYNKKVVKHVENVEKVIKRTSYEVEEKTTSKSAIPISPEDQSSISPKLSIKLRSSGSARRSSLKQQHKSEENLPRKSNSKNVNVIGSLGDNTSIGTNKSPKESKSPEASIIKSNSKGKIKDETVEEMQLINKSLYVGLLKRYYYVKYISNEDNPIDDRKFYNILKARNYISEGANFLLHRYLAKTIYIGTFELSTMYINGDLCRNIYHCTGPESENINGRKIDICKIYRTIIEECGLEHHCTTILSLQGQIVCQKWEGSNYVLQINPLLEIDNYKIARNEQLLLKHSWESDMQLMSKFLDEKIANEIKIKSYMIDHPEFRNMITDYIHTILLLKPEDIIEFTTSHFLSFAPQYLPQNDYF